MRILIAEDDPELARQALGWLDEAGHQTRWCTHGREALKSAMDPAF